MCSLMFVILFLSLIVTALLCCLDFLLPSIKYLSFNFQVLKKYILFERFRLYTGEEKLKMNSP